MYMSLAMANTLGPMASLADISPSSAEIALQLQLTSCIQCRAVDLHRARWTLTPSKSEFTRCSGELHTVVNPLLLAWGTLFLTQLLHQAARLWSSGK